MVRIRSMPHDKNGSGKDGEYGELSPSAIRLGNPLLFSQASASKVVTIHFEASAPCHLVLVGMQCQNRDVWHNSSTHLFLYHLFWVLRTEEAVWCWA